VRGEGIRARSQLKRNLSSMRAQHYEHGRR
jgi:hypothetical protein